MIQSSQPNSRKLTKNRCLQHALVVALQSNARRRRRRELVESVWITTNARCCCCCSCRCFCRFCRFGRFGRFGRFCSFCCCRLLRCRRFFRLPPNAFVFPPFPPDCHGNFNVSKMNFTLMCVLLPPLPTNIHFLIDTIAVNLELQIDQYHHTDVFYLLLQLCGPLSGWQYSNLTHFQWIRLETKSCRILLLP